ncbi:putative dehydrogenase [Abditibacterium utsteinense]|uniref:Putative dehydrogenase n=1 Tax=Abditibacterium utsteinense TaxID=1960156 RepID=A0A2S8ST09_9BACT|nr:Gfo/Idh/MocA family oxidoreductase [Abditibacterium utsteinense]PQV63916.1 putative dehydrogenase [Abditibacterium utsteinense]
MNKKEVGIGLIGYAFMGKTHSNAYRQVTKFFEPSVTPKLRAICGRSEANVARAAEHLGWESYETDWRKLIDRPDIDIVDISTPGNEHKEMAIYAAKAGKTVFCEKPLGNSFADAKEMLDAAEANKVVNMVCFNYRRVPAIALAKRMIENGDLGRIYHFRARYLQDWIADPNFPLVWRLQKEIAGSGTLGDIGAHILDLSTFLVGRINSLSGMTETFVKERPLQAATTGTEGLTAKASTEMGQVTVDDAAAFMARFENGAMGVFEATRFAPGRRNFNTFEINGEKGSISFNFERMNELEYFSTEDKSDRQGFRTINVNENDQPYSGVYWPAGHIIGYEHTFINTVYDLLEGHAKGESPKPTFKCGAYNNLLLETVEKSAESKKWEDVPEF